MATNQRIRSDLDLSVLPIFERVPDHLLRRVTPEFIKFYSDGEVIFREGEQADSLVILLYGQAGIYTDDIFLVSRAPFEILGEQAVINESVRSATVVAQGSVKALFIPRQIVDDLMANAVFMGNLLRIVSKKLAEATNARAYHYYHEQLLFSEFRSHVAPEVLNRLLATGINYGEPRYINAIILFSDIRSFTDRSSRMMPQEIASQLGPYLDAVVDVIHRHEGMVDKFIGDAVMAIWGFTATQSDIARQAFHCAEEMVAVARKLHFGGDSIRIGVGLNAGQVFMGNVGSDGKRQFTVLGTPVNLAARFESATKDFNAPIVVGEAFYDRLASDLKARLTERRDCPIKGSEKQTLYTYDPTSRVVEEA